MFVSIFALGLLVFVAGFFLSEGGLRTGFGWGLAIWVTVPLLVAAITIPWNHCRFRRRVEALQSLGLGATKQDVLDCLGSPDHIDVINHEWLTPEGAMWIFVCWCLLAKHGILKFTRDKNANPSAAAPPRIPVATVLEYRPSIDFLIGKPSKETFDGVMRLLGYPRGSLRYQLKVSLSADDTVLRIQVGENAVALNEMSPTGSDSR